METAVPLVHNVAVFHVEQLANVPRGTFLFSDPGPEQSNPLTGAGQDGRRSPSEARTSGFNQLLVRSGSGHYD